MSDRSLSDEQIQALDFQIDRLYEAFRRAIPSQLHEDAIWLKELFGGFGKSIAAATNNAAFMDWNRSDERAAHFDKYLLHHTICNNPSYVMEQVANFRKRGHSFNSIATHVALADLRRAIDDPKRTYYEVRTMARSLGDAHKFDDILNAIEHVREKYPRLK